MYFLSTYFVNHTMHLGFEYKRHAAPNLWTEARFQKKSVGENSRWKIQKKNFGDLDNIWNNISFNNEDV